MADKANANSYESPLEKSFARVVTPLEHFLHNETASGILLMFATVAALIMANTGLHHFYHDFFHAPVSINIAGYAIDMSLHHWINDGFMTFFFFVVGLEIKRELLVGELSDMKAALLPIIAAAGGMIFPALIYASLNGEGPGAAGWGVPMATDIAFAVGVMMLLGNQVPKTLITFLLALAIVDDLGAVLVIAIFYTEQLNMLALAWAGVFLLLLILINMVGIRKSTLRVIITIALWVAMLNSGIHATIAGVLAAFTVPCMPKVNARDFSDKMRYLMDKFDRLYNGRSVLLNNDKQRAVAMTMENVVTRVKSPLQTLEQTLHLPVAFIILPIFALANAGVMIDPASLGSVMTDPVALGIMGGLVLGKIIGISGLSLLAVRLGIGQLPAGCNSRHIIGVGMMGGIGFTMSIFIAELGFRGSAETLNIAKTGVLFASIVAGVMGFLWLKYMTGKPADSKS